MSTKVIVMAVELNKNGTPLKFAAKQYKQESLARKNMEYLLTKGLRIEDFKIDQNSALINCVVQEGHDEQKDTQESLIPAPELIWTISDIDSRIERIQQLNPSAAILTYDCSRLIGFEEIDKRKIVDLTGALFLLGQHEQFVNEFIPYEEYLSPLAVCDKIYEKYESLKSECDFQAFLVSLLLRGKQVSEVIAKMLEKNIGG